MNSRDPGPNDLRPKFDVSPGEPYPIGASVRDGGVNFCVFSQNATAVELLLFGSYEDPEPFQVIRFHPHHNKTFHYWHVFVVGLRESQIYAYRVDGPFAPTQGHRFNPEKVLIDPYSRGVVYGKNWSRSQAITPHDNAPSAMKSIVVDHGSFDWEGVASPNLSLSDSVIYELHVRGFTGNPNSKVKHPGTFDGLVDKIPYLKDLGITTVELLPVHEFDFSESNFVNPETGKRVTNFWGYNTICFFAPHRRYYPADWENMEYFTSFRGMVKAFHHAGIEVILDVVFNHTCEGDENGPTICFKGFENSVYYMLDSRDPARYSNYSGCGNTVNCNHPIVRRMILDSLRYWVEVMRVDGFRFDLASILSRDEDGNPMKHPPLLWEIESDPVLQKIKLIAEAWDAGGLYQVGRFPGQRWAEWNGNYRDDIRRFVKGDSGVLGSVGARMTGSADLYQHLGRSPNESINFITCHDGFTMNDLVSYNEKHNMVNGEEDRDGSNDNHSYNYGVEGPTSDPEIENLRRRQIKNFAAILLLSQGTPMLLAGDEVRRTQGGNNNAYCQDNEISWFDWSLLEKEQEMFRFFKRMIRFRMSHDSLRRTDFFWGDQDDKGRPEIQWHGIQLNQPDWGQDSRSIAFTLNGMGKCSDIHVMINMWIEPLRFELPATEWHRIMDTSLPSPNDIVDEGSEVKLMEETYNVAPRSIVVLIS